MLVYQRVNYVTHTFPLSDVLIADAGFSSHELAQTRVVAMDGMAALREELPWKDLEQEISGGQNSYVLIHPHTCKV